jgi:hypothetical protein
MFINPPESLRDSFAGSSPPMKKGFPNHILITAKEVPITKGFSFNYLAKYLKQRQGPGQRKNA